MSYLGKISAIVSANTGDFSAKLAASGREVASWAKSLNSAVNSASTKASSSLRGIYTEAQKTERALLAIQAKKISFKGFEGQDLTAAVDRMRSLVSVTKEINNPLNQAARALERMPAAIQGGFLGAMKTAQKQAELIAIDLNQIASGKSTLSSTGLERKFEAIASRAMRTADAVERLKAVAAGVDGLATGKEMQFRNPEFAAEMARARGIQAQAAGTPGGNFAGIIERQRAAADATAAAFARMEEAQLTLGGDVAGTTAQYERQLAILREIGSELESSVAVTNARTAAEAKAVQAENQFYLRERDRRSGRLTRGNASAFDAATEELMASPANASSPIFGSPGRSVDSEIQRTRDLYQQFLQLSPEVRASLESERQSLDNIAKAARDGAAGIGTLADANDRMAASIDSAKAKMTQEEALEAARQNFSMTPEQLAATAKERGAFQPFGDIEKAAADLRAMQDEMRKLKAESDFGSRFSDSFNSSLVSSYSAKISYLRGVLIQHNVTAGDAVELLDEFASDCQRAAGEVGGLAGRTRELAASEQAAAKAIQTMLPGVDVLSGMKRAGDIGRMGVDKWSLALNQAAFAVDDFLSSTGGIEFKLRAISNNITQMAFVLGGTKGLFIGLGAVIAGQAAVALTKWINGGKTAEDQTKALNETFARQKSLIEEVSQAIEALGDQLAGLSFSKAAMDAKRFEDAIKDVVKKRDEVRLERLAAVSTDVQGSRAKQNALRRQAEEETNPGRRALLESQIAAEAENERRLLERLKTQGSEELTRSALNEGAQFRFAGSPFALARRTEEIKGMRLGDQAEARRQLEAERERLKPAADARFLGMETPESAAAAKALAAVEAALRSLEDPIAKAANEMAAKALEGSVRVAKSLEAAQQLLDETLMPFSRTREEANKAAAELSKIVEELRTAEDPARIEELEKQRAALEQQSAQYRSAAEVIRTFADTVKRISTDLVNAVEGETRSFADKSRRDYNRAAAAAAVDGEFGEDGERRRPGEARGRVTEAFVRREAAEREASRAQDEADRVREDNDRARRQFEAGIAGDPQVQAERERLEQLQAVIDSKDATEREKARAAEEKAIIQRAQDRRFEDSEAGKDARKRADDADMNAARRQEEFRQWDEKTRRGLRGRDIGLATGVIEAREAGDAIRDIEAALSRGELDRNQANEQASRFAQEQMRSAAPAIFEMADQVANAVLQGPSRQALEVSDVSTMEGSRELNRLLRGDDQAKNANLVELQKQNQKMGELVTVMKDVAQKMGIVLDL